MAYEPLPGERPDLLEKKYSEIDMINALAMRDFAFADDETMQTAIRDYPKIWMRIRKKASDWFEKHKNKINA